MNKKLLAIIMLAGVITFTSCGNKGAEKKEAESKEEAKKEEPKAPARVFKNVKTDLKGTGKIKSESAKGVNNATITLVSCTQDVDPGTVFGDDLEFWKFEFTIKPAKKFEYRRKDFTIHGADDVKEKNSYAASPSQIKDGSFTDSASVSAPGVQTVTFYAEVNKAANFTPSDFVLQHINFDGTHDYKTLYLNIGTGKAEYKQ